MTEAVPSRTWSPTGTAILVLAVAGCAGISSGAPTIWSPYPAAIVLPVFGTLIIVGEATPWRWISDFIIPCLIGPLLLVAWYPGLLSGARGLPRRTVFGLTVLSMLTRVDFWWGWAPGVRYHGETYVRGVLVMNLLLLCVSWGLVRLAKRRATFEATLAAHAWIVAWLVWFAFPWLGELI